MSSGENISTLITIICGLMLTELFASMHRLIRNRRRVKWHWIPLLAAWYVLLVVLKNWWGLVFQAGEEFWGSGWMFFYYAHLLFLVYLAASAVLPDEIPEDGWNLKEFYLENRRHFWGLLAMLNLLLLLKTVLGPAFSEDPLSLVPILANTLMLAIHWSLAWVKRIWYHAVVVVLLIGLVVSEVLQQL